MSICAEPGAASESGNKRLDGAHRHRRLAAADKKSCDFAQRLAMFKVLLGASTRHSAIAQGGQPWRRCSGRAVCRCLTMPQLYPAGLSSDKLTTELKSVPSPFLLPAISSLCSVPIVPVTVAPGASVAEARISDAENCPRQPMTRAADAALQVAPPGAKNLLSSQFRSAVS
jgi:hypothetical protein